MTRNATSGSMGNTTRLLATVEHVTVTSTSQPNKTLPLDWNSGIHSGAHDPKLRGNRVYFTLPRTWRPRQKA